MKLVVIEEGLRSQLDFERDVVRIGRAIDNDIRLGGPLASRHHCRIELGRGGAWVVDLGSSNGTRVNGEKVDRRLLRPGDVLTVGGTRIVLEQVSSSEASAPDAPPDAPDPAEGASPLEDDPGEEDVGAVGTETLAGETRREEDKLRIFARLTSALAREIDLAPLLRQIVDSAVSLIGGERGFLLLAKGVADEDLVPDPSAMKVRVARAFDGSDIPIPASRVSMGIARRVIERNRPLLSVDAGEDDRFSGMASVEDLRLRSVLCLPVRIEGRVQGVLYVDNRLQRGAFNEEDLDLAEMFAGMAAIAIKNARLVLELRERNQRLLQSSEQIKALNERLGRKLKDRDSELSVVRQELDRERGRYDYSALVGASDGMRRVFKELDRIIETELPVLIRGESGTGKELIARAIHYNGPRKDRPFIVENCAALPDTLLESELFGHARGAFTGADRAKKGLVEQAHGGTLFLDEIGDMSPEMQKKLLRVLQEGEVRPLGSSQRIHVDVRLLAASHRDLSRMVEQGEFREDLFYRINVLSLELPPLRDRREDIPLLAEALLSRAAREAGRVVPALSHEVLSVLAAHSWPGNVRELENEMRRVLVLADDVVRLEHLSATIQAGAREAETSQALSALPPVVGDLRAAVACYEQRAIEEALRRAGSNKSRAAKELGISRFALQRKLDKYGMSLPG